MFFLQCRNCRNIFRPGSSKHAVRIHHPASRLGLVPEEIDLLVKDEAFLKLNHRGCVNSLKKECRHFFRTHRYDGTNDTARSVYPCFYTNRTLGIIDQVQVFTYKSSFSKRRHLSK